MNVFLLFFFIFRLKYRKIVINKTINFRKFHIMHNIKINIVNFLFFFKLIIFQQIIKYFLIIN